MKKYLLVVIVAVLIISELITPHVVVHAASPTVPPVSVDTISPTDVPGRWQEDADVTFVEKVGARAGGFLDWALREYNWVKKTNQRDDSQTLASFWRTIWLISAAFLLLAIIATAFVMIVTRGRSITFMRFLPRFALVIILMTLSFAIVQFLYQITDIIQGFFLRNPDCTNYPNCPTDVARTISQVNLLFIGFDYENFQGFRLSGIKFDESVFVSLLLVKLTAATYYVMTGILILRKVILWFFIILSPVFPLLLLFAPVRNTAKIWIGEFFRWLMYAPLFAIFLGGLVAIWRSTTGIPLNFVPPTGQPQIGTEVYPTAINILLGGPGQRLDIHNSVNLPETFALYVVALLMLWVVTLLPFLLLQIFLDYLGTVTLNENNTLRQMLNSGFGYINKNISPVGPQPSGPPGGYQPTGSARSLPFANIATKFAIPDQKKVGEAMNIPKSTGAQMPNLRKESSEILKLTNLSVPTMRDIARFETATLSKDVSKHEEVAQMHESLERIANPAMINESVDRAQTVAIRGKLIAESQQGNPMAASILSAASTVSHSSMNSQSTQNRSNVVMKKIANPTTIQNTQEREKYVAIKEKLTQESQKGNPIATNVLSVVNKSTQVSAGAPVQVQEVKSLKEQLKEAQQKGDPLAVTIQQLLTDAEKQQAAQPAAAPAFPAVNRVQQVNLDDYESVRKMWVDNYQKLDVPQNIQSPTKNREAWLKEDIDKISKTIDLLVSTDQQKIDEGMKAVSNILPFLLVGGFSQAEVVAYLKAKLEAAKTVLEESKQKNEEEDTLAETKTRKEEKPKTMTMEETVKDNPITAASDNKNPTGLPDKEK